MNIEIYSLRAIPAYSATRRRYPGQSRIAHRLRRYLMSLYAPLCSRPREMPERPSTLPTQAGRRFTMSLECPKPTPSTWTLSNWPSVAGVWSGCGHRTTDHHPRCYRRTTMEAVVVARQGVRLSCLLVVSSRDFGRKDARELRDVLQRATRSNTARP